MADAERLILARRPSACVLRISLPMGISFNGHAGAIDWIQSRFAKGRPATLYFDEVRTPAYTDCLNRLYERVLTSDLAGVFHANSIGNEGDNQLTDPVPFNIAAPGGENETFAGQVDGAPLGCPGEVSVEFQRPKVAEMILGT